MNDTITVEEYTEEVMDIMQSISGEGYESEIVCKNNKELHEIRRANHGSVAATVYTDALYEAGKSAEECADELIEALDNASDAEISTFDIGAKLQDWNWVKNNLSARVVSMRGNEKYLENKVYIESLGLALFFGVIINLSNGSGWTAINPNMMKGWGVTVDEIRAAAEKNDAKKCYIKGIQEVLIEMMTQDGADEDVIEMLKTTPTPSIPMLVITNESRVGGAALMFSREVRQRIYNKLGGAYVILPSSIHEVLAVPKEAGMTSDGLRAMVTEVNDTQVVDEDRLSYDIFEVGEDMELRLYND